MVENKHSVFMNYAKETAKLSKCVSLQVGCVAINERGKPISSGVNGTHSGSVNCNDIFTCRCPEHSAFSEEFEIHAEMNCILEMARTSNSFNRIDFYVTHSPCMNCLKHMIGLIVKDSITIDNIIYNEVFRKTTPEKLQQQKEYCLKFGVKLLSIEEILGK